MEGRGCLQHPPPPKQIHTYCKTNTRNTKKDFIFIVLDPFIESSDRHQQTEPCVTDGDLGMMPSYIQLYQLRLIKISCDPGRLVFITVLSIFEG